MANQLEYRFYSLKKSNNVPSDEETSVLRHRIDEEKLAIENLDGQIKEARAILSALMERREHHLKDLTAMNSTISVIRRVPNELWGQIFTFCAEHVRHIDSQLDRPPWTFGQVCSRWRMIVISMPMLWRSLSVRFTPETMLVVSKGTQALMNEWLSRSHPVPFDISLVSSVHSRGGIILKHVILPYADRIRKLTLSLSLRHLRPLLKLPSTMPLIEILDLSTPWGADRWNAPAISFEESSRLHTVILRSAEFLEMNILALPWSQLTELVLEHKHPVDDMLRLLSIATNLRKCRLGTWGTRMTLQGITASLNIVTHQNLRDFSTTIIDNYSSDMYPGIASLFFHHLKLPALRSADLDAWGPHELQSIADFQSRSGFSLETLSLSVKGSSAFRYLVKILDGAPSMVKLHLRVDGNARRCLEALHYVSTSSGRLVLPRVEEIYLELKYETEGYEVLDMVKRRWWSGQDDVRLGITRLKCLRVDMLSFSPEIVEQMAELGREGLVLERIPTHSVTGFSS